MRLFILSAGSLNQTAGGQSFPPSSGWQLDSVDAYTGSFIQTANRKKLKNGVRSASSSTYQDGYSGIVFVVRVSRVTRSVPTLIAMRAAAIAHRYQAVCVWDEHQALTHVCHLPVFHAYCVINSSRNVLKCSSMCLYEYRDSCVGCAMPCRVFYALQCLVPPGNHRPWVPAVGVLCALFSYGTLWGWVHALVMHPCKVPVEWNAFASSLRSVSPVLQ